MPKVNDTQSRLRIIKEAIKELRKDKKAMKKIAEWLRKEKEKNATN